MPLLMVSSTAQLVAAIAAASKLPAAALAGYVIALAPGAYDGLQLNNQTPASEVVITSQDPAHPAVIGPHVGVSQSANLTFRGLEFTKVGSADPYYAWRIAGARNLTFDHNVMHGDPAKGLPQVGGIYMLDSVNVAFTNSVWTYDANLNANRNTGLTIIGNDFSQMNKGAMELGGDVNVDIERNACHDFHSTPGTHPDCLQIFTAGTSIPPHDIVVRDNVVYPGAGNAVQGIFIQDETGSLPFTNVTVARNAVLGGMWDSIRVWNATGKVVIQDNIARSFPAPDSESTPVGAPAATITGFAGAIQLKTGPGAAVTLTGNAAQAWAIVDPGLNPGGLPSGWMPSVPGNVTLGQIQ